ncbi:ABC transporter substrate-binding protein [Candidatus Bandiella euplotis]|uniref:Amino acid ABC transporter substrate-binding protein n=1 Tax=Candidatus Bandiella euplotis TaxID=1664265 RepID=A0ABZ0UK83_9RICK|nr:ABC transporter substrate-binding protein [Candidatus Bandiella woodruffii]WPX96534.1 Putative amino acid ABC transporter substrate-binding protein [Candidatus Bandiella woodruffii]
MNKVIYSALIATCMLFLGCKEDKVQNVIKFGTSADYPPFEYYDSGKIEGFDIELARLVAKELGKEAIFEDMQFTSILAALQSGSIDAAISTITITQERKQSFDFSESYHKENLAVVYLKEQPIIEKSQLSEKKIACQLGTIMEIWLKKNVPAATVIAVDNNNQAIESLKAGHAEGVFIDGVQAKAFSANNPGLAYQIIAQADEGYGIAVKKESPLLNDINTALKSLADKGELQKLKQKWFKDN